MGRRIIAAIGIAAATAASAPIAAAPVAKVRVVNCGSQDCLLVRGHRASPNAAIRINDHPVEAQGRHTWQVRLPIDTVRDWSAPFARTLSVAVIESPATARAEAVRLPVGLLSQNLELASLVVHPN
ncbi:hypothetical protein [Sphingomonas sp.]|uniref:hypothetical protein n=1 Tax=Sphingomonas sp. TaxID=28214 RepID=UPI003B3A72A1